ncbi:MAG: hypothetical protein AB4080_25035, partial [Trichodesmium sp.]
MTPEIAFEFVNDKYRNQEGKTLSDLQKSIFCLCWEGQRYREIAARINYSEGNLRVEAGKLWKILAKLFEAPVSRTNFRGVVEAAIKRYKDRQKFPLSQQMREWFEILGYQFSDRHNFEGTIYDKRFFEWIIKIKTRRGY